MLTGFETLVEERIRRAQKRGLFDNLSGSGKPLPPDVIGATVSEDLRLSYRILKNADCLPPEVEVKKEIRRTEELLCDMEETQARYRTLKKLNYLILKLNTIRSGSAAFDMPQYYADRMVGRLEKKTIE
jgi:DnaJ homologue, subfamily C, member 28, conserved domain